MRAALVALTVVALGGAARAQPAAAPEPARTEPIGFDHLVHDRNVVTSGGESIACTRCHRMSPAGRPLGRPDHRACFGDCHGAPPKRGERAPTPERTPICTACHAPAAFVRGPGKPARLAPPWPPYTRDRDWGLALSHRAHDAVAPCASCHPVEKVDRATPAAGPPHARCAGCHRDRASHPLACTACHVAAYGPVTGPHLEAGPFAGGAELSHPRHAARGATCKGCHAAVVTADDATLLAPTTATCAVDGCHDGKAAFATTEACTRCHRRAPTETFRPERPTAAFSHGAHAPRLARAECSACHRLDRRGEAAPPGHAACAGCHRDDFASARPIICGACHLSTEPWRPLAADALPAGDTEFGARFAHATHPRDCGTCHRLAAGDREKRPPRGHVTCTGAACHAASGGPAPRLVDCEACHQLGLVADRDQARRSSPWSVRARFRHGPHDRDAEGVPLACGQCHAGAAEADSLAAVPTPTKASCQPCHDGRAAFKVTGHECARCHGGRAPAPAAAPAQ